MRESRCMSLLPRTTLHSDSDQFCTKVNCIMHMPVNGISKYFTFQELGLSGAVSARARQQGSTTCLEITSILKLKVWLHEIFCFYFFSSKVTYSLLISTHNYFRKYI
jgi:hypothetical protein